MNPSPHRVVFVAAGSFFLSLALAVPIHAQDEARVETPGVESQPSHAASLLLTGVTLVDGTGAPALLNAWILLDGERIIDVGSGAPPDHDAAQVLDLPGRSVIPGLADMHFHLPWSPEDAPANLMLHLAHGVTTLRDVGTGTLYIDMPSDTIRWRLDGLGELAPEKRNLFTATYVWDYLRWMERWLKEQELAPRFSSAGVMLYGWPPQKRFQAAGEGTRKILEGNRDAGVNFFKVHQWVSSSAVGQAIAFAAENGSYVIGHVPSGMTSVAAIDAGFRSLEHVRLRPWEVLDDPTLVAQYPPDGDWPERAYFWTHFEPDAKAVKATLNEWSERRDRFFLDPTLVEWELEACRLPVPDADVMRRLPEKLLARFEECPRVGRAEPDSVLAALRGVMRFVRLAHERGVRILAGTDAYTFGGSGVHRELELLVEAGLSPEEAIHGASGGAAEMLGASDWGTIRSGALADLVIVQGNIAQDISTVRRIEAVVVNGRLYDREELVDRATSHAR